MSAAGIVTILLAIWVTLNEDEPAYNRPEREVISKFGDRLASTDASSSGIDTEPVEILRLENLVREQINMEKNNPFASSSWYRPPPSPTPAPPPSLPPEPVVQPEPTAPPLPFSYLGRYEDGTKRLVLLLRGDQMYTVADGDSIDNNYRVGNIEGRQIEMVYLPLGIIQTIDTGEYAFSAKKQKRGP